VPEVCGVQVAPSSTECRIRPPEPTAKTSLGPLPQTAARPDEPPAFWIVQFRAVVVRVQEGAVTHGKDVVGTAAPNRR